jgi:hypothetical protein
MNRIPALLVAAILLVGLAPAPASATLGALPGLPPGWPTTFQVGLSSGPGDAAKMQATAPYAFRSQYLAGGVNTGNGWANWNTNGAFVTYYAQDSLDHGITPVFDYYQIVQSLPAGGADEGASTFINLNNTATMNAYYADLKLFYQRAGAFTGKRIIFHFEPDFWGFMHARAGSSDNASTISAKVASTGIADLAGLPDTVAGFAQAAARLRDRYAPNVELAYNVSSWATGNDILYSKPADAVVDALGARAAAFYTSLGTSFDLAFFDPSDRDAAFKQFQYGDGGAAWWSAGDYARHARLISRFVALTGKRVLLWQIPLGNTKMRAMNNTWGHYQDNHVEWLLDDPSHQHVIDYMNAGVVGLIFGGGAAGTTCACDAINDGITNPAPINGNTTLSVSADDDGGFFHQKAAAYYAGGPLALPGSTGPVPTPPPSATPTPSPSPTVPPGPCVVSTGPGIPPPTSVAQGLPGFHAAWYGQSGYSTFCSPTRTMATATVAFLNTGSAGWVRGRMGEVAYLGTWSPEPGQDQPSPLGGDGQQGSPSTGWPRFNRIALQPADYVGPGQIAWFQFTIQAPSTPGVYRLYLRPVVEGANWMEDYGVFWIVTVR